MTRARNLADAIHPKIKLTPTATGSAPSGSEGLLYYDSTKNSLMYYDTSWQKISGAQASGGTISFYSTYKVHTFKADGTFIVDLTSIASTRFSDSLIGTNSVFLIGEIELNILLIASSVVIDSRS